MSAPAENRSTALNPTAWVDEHGDYLYRFALSRLRDPDSSEEVVQETLFAALRHVDQYAAKGSERAWLLGILRRKIVDCVRQRSRAATLDAGDEAEDFAESLFDQSGSWRSEWKQRGYQPIGALEREEFWQAFRQCLETVPQRQADVFVLREMEDQTTDEICKELSISPSNLWVLLYRARTRLSECLKNRWQKEEE